MSDFSGELDLKNDKAILRRMRPFVGVMRTSQAPRADGVIVTDDHNSASVTARTASRHHRDPVRAINDGVSALGAKADIPPQGRDFRV